MKDIDKLPEDLRPSTAKVSIDQNTAWRKEDAALDGWTASVDLQGNPAAINIRDNDGNSMGLIWDTLHWADYNCGEAFESAADVLEALERAKKEQEELDELRVHDYSAAPGFVELVVRIPDFVRMARALAAGNIEQAREYANRFVLDELVNSPRN